MQVGRGDGGFIPPLFSFPPPEHPTCEKKGTGVYGLRSYHYSSKDLSEGPMHSWANGKWGIWIMDGRRLKGFISFLEKGAGTLLGYISVYLMLCGQKSVYM